MVIVFWSKTFLTNYFLVIPYQIIQIIQIVQLFLMEQKFYGLIHLAQQIDSEIFVEMQVFLTISQ